MIATVSFTELRRRARLNFGACQEFTILTFMMQNLGHVISREELLSEVWSHQNYPRMRTAEKH
jgi:DNA-binding response OmpR family regulator